MSERLVEEDDVPDFVALKRLEVYLMISPSYVR
jgi:hypothetical protein